MENKVQENMMWKAVGKPVIALTALDYTFSLFKIIWGVYFFSLETATVAVVLANINLELWLHLYLRDISISTL